MALPEGFAALNFDEYHRRTLPGLLAGDRAARAGRAAMGRRSIALSLGDGRAYTYRPADGTVEIVAGDAAADTVLALDLEAWQGLVHELEAPAGLLYAGRVRCVRGDAVDLMSWESALRALYNGRAPYDGATLDLRDRHGEPLDLQRTFALGADSAPLSHFLATTGYLFVRGVFGADEVATLLAEADALRAEARKGDKLSWWGKNAGGDEVLCRVTRGCTKPQLGALPTDRRILALRDLADGPFAYRAGEGQGVTVIFKNPGMTEGLGDLPWHRDCGMGGHATMCPVLVMSVYLTEASPDTGELCMLPGSLHAAVNAHDPGAVELPAAHFHARAGDVSLHYSDTVHAAPPPRAESAAGYRISAVLSFARPIARHHRGEDSYNAVLHQRADGQIEHLTTVARRL